MASGQSWMDAGRRAVQLLALAALVALAGCVSSGGRKPIHSQARAPAHSTAKPVIKPMSDPQAFKMCTARLDAAQITYQPLPNQERGGGCAIIDSVKLLDFGTPTASLGAMTCDLAATFAAWTRYAVRPAARLYLGSELVRIETFGTYACRDIRGAGGTIAGKLSEHAHANAIDVSAFVLADGRRISVIGDWTTDGPSSVFLHVIHDSACRRFRTVLSPDYNEAHHDHLHFDMGGKGGYCR